MAATGCRRILRENSNEQFDVWETLGLIHTEGSEEENTDSEDNLDFEPTDSASNAGKTNSSDGAYNVKRPAHRTQKRKF